MSNESIDELRIELNDISSMRSQWLRIGSGQALTLNEVKKNEPELKSKQKEHGACELTTWKTEDKCWRKSGKGETRSDARKEGEGRWMKNDFETALLETKREDLKLRGRLIWQGERKQQDTVKDHRDKLLLDK